MNTKITFLQLNSNLATNLDSNQPEINSELHKIICEICYRYYKANRTIYILCPDQKYCYLLDEYIVNYHKIAFFPYSLLNQGSIPPASICIGDSTTTKLKYDILINLHSIIPDNFIKYNEIIELVTLNKEQRQLSREHYKHYRKHGFAINIDIASEVSKDSC